MKILILNGPNLNLLGIRQPETYGSRSFEEYLLILQKSFHLLDLVYAQTNIEGELINFLHGAEGKYQGVVLNAGAYTHTSIAIADAIAAISCPVVEVHVSNIFAREDFRHCSPLGKNCKGSISGFGLDSYNLALHYFMIQKENTGTPVRYNDK